MAINNVTMHFKVVGNIIQNEKIIHTKRYAST